MTRAKKAKRAEAAAPYPTPQVDPTEWEWVAIGDVKPHPRNYKKHPDDQLAHIEALIRANGFFKNVVVARDGTLLAGHGVVLAARRMGLDRVPVVRLDVAPDDPRAMKVLAGDNEIANLAMVDDRALSEFLKHVMDADSLLGTGFDEKQLAALVMVTRPESEILDKAAAAEWLGMPELGAGDVPYKVVVSFKERKDRDEFLARVGSTVTDPEKRVHSLWWPDRGRRDIASVRFVDGAKPADG